MSEQLDLNRLLGLLRGDLLNRYRAVLTVSAAIAGIMFLQALLNWPRIDDPTPFYVGLLGVMLFIWGPIAASRSFLEMHDKKRNEAYLLLPASALEKVLARLLLITVIFAVYAIVFVPLVSWLSAGVRMLIHGQSTELFSPTVFVNTPLLLFFLLNQSLFFLGGAWFRKQQFFKTILALIALWLGFTCVVFIAVRLFFPEIGIGGLELTVNPGELFADYGEALVGLGRAFVWIYHLGGSIFCWTVAWFRVREVQVSHGI